MYYQGYGGNYGCGYEQPACCHGGNRGYAYAIILVLFILLVIIGCSCLT